MGLTIKGVEAAIVEKRGNISAIARGFGVTRATVYRKINSNEGLKEALVDARETMLDGAEDTLYDKALGGDTTCLIFYLKTQGKSRGYTERQEVTGADGGAVQIEATVSNALKKAYGDG